MARRWLMLVPLFVGCTHDWDSFSRVDGATDSATPDTTGADAQGVDTVTADDVPVDSVNPDIFTRDVSAGDSITADVLQPTDAQGDADLDGAVMDAVSVSDVLTDTVATVDVPCTMMCSGICTETNSDPMHCGSCTRVCTAGAHQTPTCTAGTCSSPCSPGFVTGLLGGCNVPDVKLMAPISTAIIGSDHPTLSWSIDPAARGGNNVHLTVCADAACLMPEVSADVVGTSSWTVTSSLSIGPHFWRARADAEGVLGADSKTWEFFVSSRTPSTGTVGFAPDFNGDGLIDIVVGSPDTTGGGAVYVFFNSRAGFGGPVAITPGLGERDTSAPWGVSVAALGDVTGDGLGDLGVGQACPTTTGCTGSSRAHVYVFPGAVTMAAFTTGKVTYHEDTGLDRFGAALTGLGDVNGDGFGDVGVSAPTLGAADEGRVYVFAGPIGGIASFFPATIETLDAGGLFGTALAGGGDLNNDGLPELYVGAPGVAGSRPGAGRVYGFQYAASLTPPYQRFTVGDGSFSNGHFGASVALAGDLNADAYGDLLVGTPDTISGGEVAVLAGGATLGANTLLNTIPATTAMAGAGSAVCGVGDMNGDGAPEVAVGQAVLGQVVIYSHAGSGTMSTFGSLNGMPGFGGALAAINDYDRDGFTDVLVGNSGTTEVTILRGGTDILPVSVPAVSGNRFGGSVARRIR